MVYTIHLHESAMGACPSPILNPPLHLSPTPSSGFSQSTIFEFPDSYIKIALVIYFIYGNIHFCMYVKSSHPLKSSHPCLLLKNPSLSLHLCLFCCLAYRIVIIIFLNSIYIYAFAYSVGVSLSVLLCFV